MPLIKLEILIDADQQTCFDLSRSIDVHTQSMATSRETAVAGRTAGLLQLHESVTWRARHFGWWWTLTSRITQSDPPNSFTDEMLKGPFKAMRHTHIFVPQGKQTLMKDEFCFRSPLGFLGRFADRLILKRYMRQLLSDRNQTIKQIAEGKH